jgi:biopolymer transport protein ExbB/TolQ
MIITIIILSVLLLIALYICFNLYKKNTLLLNEVYSLNSIEQDSINLVTALLVTYTKVLARLVRIDRRGSFESDDEVGFVFKTIKSSIEELKHELTELQKHLNQTDEQK